MIDFKKLMPSKVNTVFVAKTKYGIRRVMCDSFYGGYRYIDCVNTMQNSYCNPFDIYEWEYEDRVYMDDMLFRESWVGVIERREKAEEILNRIKKPKYKLMVLKIKSLLRL